MASQARDREVTVASSCRVKHVERCWEYFVAWKLISLPSYWCFLFCNSIKVYPSTTKISHAFCFLRISFLKSPQASVAVAFVFFLFFTFFYFYLFIFLSQTRMAKISGKEISWRMCLFWWKNLKRVQKGQDAPVRHFRWKTRQLVRMRHVLSGVCTECPLRERNADACVYSTVPRKFSKFLHCLPSCGYPTAFCCEIWSSVDNLEGKNYRCSFHTSVSWGLKWKGFQ